ncbi:hypothetical protein [Amycolatopsis sp. PS_44_ISF1]|uniref:hypothetical protein n=1 Tax=Amycolatopsis sp. PS_44_ISF1 TaxID=2974917 RepID=UPI0028DD4863|nr:hypothetical protein [Amycolatopsis sp. PS_44_ISF1]MDT8916231.1 hypothetical protein [Amycolatopsis sp. PS_44_ISF1]
MAFGNRGSAVIGQSMVQPDHRGIVERIVPFLPSWAAAGALWPVSALTHAMWGTDPAALPWATAGLTLVSAALTGLTYKTSHDAGGYRAHSVTTVAGSTAWLTAATIAGPGAHPLLDMWLMGAPALALSWNIRRVLKVSSKDSAAGGGENQLFKAVKLAGTKIRGELAVGPNKVQIPLQLPAGEMTADDVTQAKGRIASALSVSKNSVRVIPDPDHHDRAELVIVPTNMLKESVPWPGPSAPGGSIMEPLVVAIYEDGAPVEFWLPGDKSVEGNPRNASHGMVMGMNGAGKSHGGKIGWTEILTRKDVNLWVADPVKGKQTLGRFANKVHWPAITRQQSEAMVAVLPTVITDRTNHLAERRLDQWVPGCGLQYLVVWIEEAATLMRDSDDLVELVQTARSAGISIFLSLQRAHSDQMPTSVRAQLGIRWCFGVDKTRDAEFCLSEEVVDAGADPAVWKNKRPGCSYLEAPGVDDERFTTPNRTYNAKDDDMIAAIDAAGGPAAECAVTARSAGHAYRTQRYIPDATTEAAPEARGDVDTTAAGDDTRDGDSDDETGYQMSENHEPELDGIDADTELPNEDPATVFQFPRQKITTGQAEQLLLDVLTELRNRGADTVGPKDIPQAFKQVRSRPWVSAAMGRLADHGKLIETAVEGRYAFPPADPQDTAGAA